jgi:hypothetical protein
MLLLQLAVGISRAPGVLAQGPGGQGSSRVSAATANEPSANRQARRPVNSWPTDVLADPIGTPAPGTVLGIVPPAEESVDEAVERFELAETMAQVGDQYILKGEILGDANLLLFADFARLSKLPPQQQAQVHSALVAQRTVFMEQLLTQAIDRKLLYLEFARSMPVLDDKKMEEMKRERQKRVSTTFRKELQEMVEKVQKATPEEYGKLFRQDQQLCRIALAMKEAHIESADDLRLDRLLKDNKSSLQIQEQAFMERMLGQMHLRQKANIAPEITHEQMLQYYREHIDEFQVPMRARWEQLSVLFKRTPDRELAGNMIAEMGNRVRFGGAPFHAVAQKYSQEKNAERGGFHDWTTYNDLSISLPINDVVFTIELNKLSWIVEDEDGWHIVRVLEREAAHVRPFSEAQIEIKEKLKIEMQNKAFREYVEGLRKKTPVWTAKG